MYVYFPYYFIWFAHVVALMGQGRDKGTVGILASPCVLTNPIKSYFSMCLCARMSFAYWFKECLTLFPLFWQRDSLRTAGSPGTWYLA